MGHEIRGPLNLCCVRQYLSLTHRTKDSLITKEKRMTPVSGTSRISILFSAFIAIVGLSVLGGCASGVKVAPTPTTTSTPPATTPPPPPSTPAAPGAASPMALAYNAVTNLFYVANGSGNTVSVVDGTSFKNLD